ncbi:MAG TPA: beta-1,3-glucanase family protein, partial [Nannocystis sp.]
VYACSGYFDSQPPNCMPATKDCHFEGNKWCAALNRGMLNDPESVDTSEYYQSTPHNTYSKWVHATCPGIYAFAYDDYPASGGESGFRACKAPRLDITFCPAG